MNKDAHILTRCIHGGQQNCEVTGAVMPPIYTSSTYAQESPGVHKGYEYSRSHNLTRYGFERQAPSDTAYTTKGCGLTEERGTGYHGDTLRIASPLSSGSNKTELEHTSNLPLMGLKL